VLDKNQEKALKGPEVVLNISQLINNAGEEILARGISGCEGVIIVCAFAGRAAKKKSPSRRAVNRQLRPVVCTSYRLSFIIYMF
jgi:hypothetical protein